MRIGLCSKSLSKENFFKTVIEIRTSCKGSSFVVSSKWLWTKTFDLKINMKNLRKKNYFIVTIQIDYFKL